jgi:hypothetical protein
MLPAVCITGIFLKFILIFVYYCVVFIMLITSVHDFRPNWFHVHALEQTINIDQLH